MFGWDDTVWNHITARAPGTKHNFFMHEMGLLYEEVKASNLIKVDENGKVLEGPKKANTAGFIIHAVHLNHPKNKFVFHAHPPSALAATALKNGNLFWRVHALVNGYQVGRFIFKQRRKKKNSQKSWKQ